MIKILAKAVALVALLFTVSSCNMGDISGKITGTWELVSFAGRATEADVFITFSEDNSFTLYQRENSLSYTVLVGNYVYDEENHIVTGEYASGSAWNNSYQVLTLKKDTLIWETINGETEVSEYRRGEAPKVVSRGQLNSVEPFL